MTVSSLVKLAASYLTARRSHHHAEALAQGPADMVSGDARTDLAWMQAGGGDWVAKIGADAVQAIGIRSAGIGIAIKVADGAVRALHPATYAVLDQLGLLDDTRRKHLAPYRAPPIKNARGTVAGDIHAVFTLSKPGSDPDFGQFPKNGV